MSADETRSGAPPDDENDEELTQFEAAIELRNRLDDALRESQQLRRERDHLQAEVESYRDEQQQWKKQAEAAIELRKRLDEALRESQQLRRERDSLRDNAGTYQREKEGLKSQLAELRKALSQRDTSQTEVIAALEAEQQLLIRELKELQIDSKTWDQDRKNLQDQILELSSRNAELQSQQTANQEALQNIQKANLEWKEYADGITVSKDKLITEIKQKASALGKQHEDLRVKFYLSLALLSIVLVIFAYIALVPQSAFKQDDQFGGTTSRAQQQIAQLQDAVEKANIEREEAAQKLAQAVNERVQAEEKLAEAEKRPAQVQEKLENWAENLAGKENGHDNRLTVGLVVEVNFSGLQIVYNPLWRSRIMQAKTCEIWRVFQKIGDASIVRFEERDPILIVSPDRATFKERPTPGDLVKIALP